MTTPPGNRADSPTPATTGTKTADATVKPVHRLLLAGRRALAGAFASAAWTRHRRAKRDLPDEEFFADEFWALWRTAAQASSRAWQPDTHVKEETLPRILAMPPTP
jgi:hypothetical protein